MFTEEEAAKEFAKSYVEKNTPLLTVKVLRKQMPNFYMGFCKLLGCFFFGKHVYLIIKGFRIALYIWEFCDLGKGHIDDFHALEFLHGEAVVYCHLWLSPFFALRGYGIPKISM